MKSLTDCLSRHVWDSTVIQCAVNNLVVSFFIYYASDFGGFEHQINQLVLNIIAGCLQVLVLLLLFTVEIIPKEVVKGS
jgi:hypothetical protein